MHGRLKVLFVRDACDSMRWPAGLPIGAQSRLPRCERGSAEYPHHGGFVVKRNFPQYRRECLPQRNKVGSVLWISDETLREELFFGKRAFIFRVHRSPLWSPEKIPGQAVRGRLFGLQTLGRGNILIKFVGNAF